MHFSKYLLILNTKKITLRRRLLIFLLLITSIAGAQVDITLYQQFNGRYDFTFVGNTLNVQANGANDPCQILTSSVADLNLAPEDEIIAAYLYWSGSGTGDFDVTLNGENISATRDFPAVFISPQDLLPRDFFSAFADVTSIVQTTGNGTYTLSNLDLTDVINTDVPPNQHLYCRNGTNFGGWVIFVVYKNEALPLNQLNLYDGLEFVPQEINITLPSLNVIDNEGAKIGFIAWEGDQNIANSETLSINEIALSNVLNPVNNAFNGTNSVTGATDLFNMDLDIYDIQNMINIGDETAEIRLESSTDFVMVNAIITKLNSQLPDATVTIDNVIKECNSHTIEVDYTVYNINSTDVLPAGTPVAIYVDGNLIATTQTLAELPIGGSESGTIIITLPAEITGNFQLIFIVDDTGNGTGTVTETNEENNSFIISDFLLTSPPLEDPADITVCETANGSGIGLFDFSGYEVSLKNNPTDIVRFYISLANAQNNIDFITNPESYTSTSNPQEIFVRLEDENGCYSTGSFLLIAVDCLFPDGTVSIDDVGVTCNSRTIDVVYTINNFNSQDILPAGTPIAIYAAGELISVTETFTDIAINGSEEGVITLTLLNNIPLNFELTFIVDDTGNGIGLIPESDEENNTFTVTVSIPESPVIEGIPDVVSCNKGMGLGTFDFSHYQEDLKNSPTDVVYFYTSESDAILDNNRISDPSDFTSTSNPQQIFVRVNDGTCFSLGAFLLYTKNCPPTTYNYITPNGDGINDSFFVDGLRNIFLNFKMSIYNRWGALVWTGTHSQTDWDGIADVAKIGSSDTTVPVGTYYFVLELNDPDFPQPIVGWVYVSK